MDHPPKTPPIAPRPAPTEPARLESTALFRGGNAIEIEHAGQRYLLRITRENKLILTK